MVKGKVLALCIPTWNRAAVIDKLLGQLIKMLKEYGVDLHLYDSSPNNDTELVAEKYQKKFANLIFHKVDEKIPSNEKFFDICTEMEGSSYSHIWIIQDHLLFTEQACRFLLEKLEDNADFYFLDMQNDCYSCKVEGDLNDFARRNAWMLTRFGTAILKTETFISGVDWREKKAKWLQKTTLNNAHVGLYFERLAEMKDARVETVSFVRDQFYDLMRLQPVSWDQELLRICLECWGTTIENLPDSYNKTDIVQSQDSLFISATKLLTMKEEGRYGIPEYNRYKKWIEKVYPQRKKLFEDIATMSKDSAEKKYLGGLLNNIQNADLRGNKKYIYGAGRHAAELASYFDKRKIEFDGFLVSKKDGNPQSIAGHEVYIAKDMISDGEVLVIVAVAEQSVPSIKAAIEQLNNKSINITIVAGEL